MEQEKKTGYEWCLQANIRLLNLMDWDSDSNEFPFCSEAYYKEKIDSETFMKRIADCKIKPNSQPRKTEMFLEYRMYGLVAYQLCGTIHAGIQYGHAVVDYGQMIKTLHQQIYGQATSINHATPEAIYDKWANEDKTFIILNGGTTNNNPERLGSLNTHLINLLQAGIRVQDFYEPDLGDQLTAVVFLVDERVFNRDLYPDFVPEVLPWNRKKPSEIQLKELDYRNAENYKHWLDKIGGPKNAFLREYLKPLRLA